MVDCVVCTDALDMSSATIRMSKACEVCVRACRGRSY